MIQKAATKCKMVVYGYSYLSLSNRKDKPCIKHSGKKAPVKREPWLGGSWDAKNQENKKCVVLNALTKSGRNVLQFFIFFFKLMIFSEKRNSTIFDQLWPFYLFAFLGLGEGLAFSLTTELI